MINRPPRTGPSFEPERALGRCVAGIDEAGRGPLAGPVGAAAVVLNPARLPVGLDDSKRLTRARREALFEALMRDAVVGVGMAEVAEIDRINILQATMQAMARAVAALPLVPDACLVDGNCAPGLAVPAATLVGGDRLSASVAAASVIAKVTRDRIMAALDDEFPDYGWRRNAGYGTAEHLAALRRCGPTQHHRRSFAPVAQLVLSGI